MRTTLLLAATALALVSSSVVAQPTAPASATAPTPSNNQNAALAAFFEDYDARQLALSPEGKAYRGIRDADYGRWSDYSEAGEARRHKLGQDALAEMRRRFKPGQLTGQSRLSYRLFENQMTLRARAWPFRDYGYTFDQMNGAQSDAPAFLINIHRIDTAEHARAYISRLNGVAGAMDQAIEAARRSEKLGVVPPRWVFPYVLEDAKNVTSGAPFTAGADSALFADFKAKVGKLQIAQPQKDALIAEASTAMTRSLAPAYARMVAFVRDQQSRAPTDDGIWRLPRGGEYYAERLANYTTTTMTPAQVHDLGLAQVARIHGEMGAIQRQVGFQGTLQQFFTHMKARPQNFYPNTPAGRAMYLTETSKALAAMRAKLPQYFNTLPKDELVVKAVEPFREKSAGKAFYQDPAPDGSRPGTYYVNLYDTRDMPNTEVEALAYHEGLPGHHLDGSVTTQLKDLPPFRRFGGYTVWSEGWGLYAEKLGKDMGFYTDPYRDFGRLQLELHRAIRLVVDTGLHDKRWSRERAIQYVADNSADAPGGIVKAIERYAVYPGQATAYMIGRLKISELRDRAQRELGPRFTMGEFHDAILLSGGVPLDILEENVNAYIVAKKGGGAAATR